MKRVCDICGREFDSNLAFCDACGTPVPGGQGIQSEQEIPIALQVDDVRTKGMPDKTGEVVSVGTYFGLTVLFAIPVIGLIASIITIFVSKNKNVKNYAKAMSIWLVICLLIGSLLFFATFKLARVVGEKMDAYEKQIEETAERMEQLEGLGDLLDGLKGIGDYFESFGDYGDSFEQFGDYGDSFKQFGDYGDSLDQFGDLGELFEQFENSDLGDLFHSFGME